MDNEIKTAVRPYQGISGYSHLPVWQKAFSGLSHPALAKALLDYCLAMSAPTASTWAANKVFNQKLRYIVAYTLVGNYTRFLDDASFLPTLTALQARLEASPRQVAELVKNMRLGGYVEAIRDPHDRRFAHLKPTDLLLREVAKSPLFFLKGAEEIGFCDAGTLDALHATPDSMMRWMGLSASTYQKEDVFFGPFSRVVRFSERDAGYLLLTAVMATAYMAAQGQKPPFSLTYDALAEKFGVSRQHIGNLFAEAEPVLVIRSGTIQSISSDLIDEFNTFALGQMAHYSLIAEEVLRKNKD